LFLDGSPFLELAKFGEGSAEDEVGLGPGAVYGFSMPPKASSTRRQRRRPQVAPHDFDGEGLFDGVFGSHWRNREPDAGKSTITDGKIEGDNIIFSITGNMQGNEMKLTYKATVTGDRIKLKVDFGGGGQTVEYTLKRVT